MSETTTAPKRKSLRLSSFVFNQAYDLRYKRQSHGQNQTGAYFAWFFDFEGEEQPLFLDPEVGREQFLHGRLSDLNLQENDMISLEREKIGESPYKLKVEKQDGGAATPAPAQAPAPTPVQASITVADLAATMKACITHSGSIFADLKTELGYEYDITQVQSVAQTMFYKATDARTVLLPLHNEDETEEDGDLPF